MFFQHILRFLIVLALFTLVVSCSSKSAHTNILGKGNAKTPKEVFTFPKFNAVSDAFVDRCYDSISMYYTNRIKSDFNGMFLIAKNGKVIYERYQGFANKNNNIHISKSTPLHVASISKVITAYIIMLMVQEGKLELDKDIRSYLPEIMYEGITLRMLLNHRSGIPYYGYFPASVWPYAKDMTNAAMLRTLNKQQLPLYFPPNSQFSYCNTNYALLALIAERIDKKRFPDIAKRRIFDPLGMKNSFILHDKINKDSVSQSYDSRNHLEPFTNLDGVYGDKNLYTTARDLLQLDKASYSDDFLADSLKRQMFKGYSYEHAGKSNYGLGFRMREERGKSTFLFHTGWWHGNTGCYATLRQDTVCMIILSNHYTKKVYSINRLSVLFGNYPFAPLIDGKENFIKPEAAQSHIRKYKKR